MWYSLPTQQRLNLMKSYKTAYPGMSYNDMIEHFNQGVKQYGNGGIIPTSGYEPVGKYPSVPNADGTSSNEITMSIGTEDGSYIIPTMWEGKKHTGDEAINRFERTGLHMGKFANDKDAERGAQLREFINNNVAPYSQQPKQYGEGGKVEPYQAKDQKDYQYRMKMYNDSLTLYNSAAVVKKYLDDNPTAIATTSKKGDIDLDTINPYKKGAKKTEYKDITVYEYDKPKQQILPPKSTNNPKPNPVTRVAPYREEPMEPRLAPYREEPAEPMPDMVMDSNGKWVEAKKRQSQLGMPDVVMKANFKGGTPKQYGGGGPVKEEPVEEPKNSYYELYGKPKLNLTPQQVQKVVNAKPNQEARKELIKRKPHLHTVEDYKAGIKEPGVENDILSDPVAMAAGTVAGGVGLGAYTLSQVPKMFATELLSEGTAGLSNLAKSGLKRITLNPKQNLSNTLTEAKDQFSKAVKGSSSVLSEIKGELSQGKLNRQAIKEGNEWLNNWVKHPATQNKLDRMVDEKLALVEDMKKTTDINLDGEVDLLNLMRTQTKEFNPNTQEYGLLKQVKDNLKQYVKKDSGDPIHLGNWGVSYRHNQSPYYIAFADRGDIKPFDRFGSWVTRNKKLPQEYRTSTTIHEGTHDWVPADTFSKLGMRNTALSNMDSAIKDDFLQWEKYRKQGIKPETMMGEARAYQAYLADPTELHARIMELRKELGLNPEQEVTSEFAGRIIDWMNKGGSKVDPAMLNVINKDPHKLATLFNRFLVGAPVVLGANQLMQNKDKKQ